MFIKKAYRKSSGMFGYKKSSKKKSSYKFNSKKISRKKKKTPGVPSWLQESFVDNTYKTRPNKYYRTRKGY